MENVIKYFLHLLCVTWYDDDSIMIFCVLAPLQTLISKQEVEEENRPI